MLGWRRLSQLVALGAILCRSDPARGEGASTVALIHADLYLMRFETL